MGEFALRRRTQTLKGDDNRLSVEQSRQLVLALLPQFMTSN